MANLRLAPPLPIIPEELQGKPIVALVAMYAGTLAEGEKSLEPIRHFGKPVLDTISPKPYVAHQKMFDPALPHGRHYYWKSHKLGPLSDEVIATIIKCAEQVTSSLTTVPIFTQGGAVGRIPEENAAFPNRDAAHDINIVASWMPDDPEPKRHIEWVRKFFTALEPHSKGVYVNFTSDDSRERIRTHAYSPKQWSRLVALKEKFDPTNFFKLNANIPPAERA
jgi:hypothetical protein